MSLYAECEKVFANKPSRVTTVTRTRTAVPVANLTQVTAVATDDLTGLFVQMVGTVDTAGQVKDGPFLTFGKKFLEESKSAQLSNTAMRMWR